MPARKMKQRRKVEEVTKYNNYGYWVNNKLLLTSASTEYYGVT
jgi:hypothetical protein